MVSAKSQGPWLAGIAGLMLMASGCSDPGTDAGQEYLKSVSESPEDTQDLADAYGIDLAPASGSIQPKDVSVPTDVTKQGSFGPVFTWPVIPLHVSLLPDGRVLGYGAGADGQGGTQYYAVWNPALGTGANAITRLNNTTSTNVFCTGLALQPLTGDVVMFGGSQFINNQGNYGISAFNIFRTSTNALENQTTGMTYRRWYPGVVTTWDGKQVILGGRDYKEFAGNASAPPTTATYSYTPELYTPGQGFTVLTGATNQTAFSGDYGNWNYPRAWQAPNGKLFLASVQGKPYWIDFTGTGAITPVAGMPDIPRSFVSLPAVMFQPGKVLSLGMGTKATIIDFNPATPTWKATAPPAQLRLWSNATVQADGKVFVNGGSLVNNETDGVSYRSETWDPATGQWTPGAVATRMRLYHSVALLLPDATILTASGGAPGPQNNNNGEIYYPPYLYKTDGSEGFAARPAITSAPSSAMDWNQPFDIGVSAGTTVSRVTFVRAASVTHAFSSDQRFMDLPFTQEGNTIHLTTPAQPTLAPPGYWMLFVFNGAGVPSVAKLIRIMDVDGVPPDDPPPDDPPPTGTTNVYDGASASAYTPILGNASACQNCALNVDAPVIAGGDGASAAKLQFKAVGAATGVYFRNAADQPARSYQNIKLSVFPTTANFSFRLEVGLHSNYKAIGPVKTVVVTAPTANQWNHLTVPMTQYADAPFNYVAIKSPNAQGSAVFYVDNVALENDAAYVAPTPPAAPAVGATPGNNEVTLSWPAVAGAGYYNVYQGTSPGGEDAIPVKAGFAGRSLTITGLTNGTPAYFTVSAINGAHVGPASSEVAATPGGAAGSAPAAPTGLSAIGADREVTLDWNPSSGAASYSVYQGTSAGGESATAVLSGITDSQATITGLANDVTYYYVVRAVNANGTSTTSNEASATPRAPLQAPATPAGLAATAGDSSILLSWAGSPGADSYQVFQGTSAGGEGAVAVKTGITATSTSITPLVNGTRYYFVVRAVNTAGSSAASNEVSAVPAASASGVNVYDGTSPGFAVTLGSAVKDCNQCAAGVNAPVIAGGNGDKAIRLQFKAVNFATGAFLRAPSPLSTSDYSNLRIAVYPTDATLSFRLEIGSRDAQYVQTGPVSNVVVTGLVANQWNDVVVPMASYKSGLFNYVAVKSANANGTAAFYVDTLSLDP